MSYDETEIKRAKIHEDAETKRVLLTQREETKRKRIAELGTMPTVAWSLMLGCTAVGMLFLAGHYVSARYPSTPPPCIEKVEIIGSLTTERQCVGGYIETTPGPGTQVTWKCLCVKREQR